MVVVITVAAALGMSLRQDPQYRAASELLIRQTNSSSIATPGVAAGVSDRQLNNEVKLFKSSAIVSAVADEYNGPLNPGAVTASVASSTSDVISVHLTAADPDEAAKLVNVYVSTFIETRRQQRVDELLSVGGEIKIDDLATRITKVRQPLTDLEARLADDPKNATLQGPNETS